MRGDRALDILHDAVLQFAADAEGVFLDGLDVPLVQHGRRDDAGRIPLRSEIGSVRVRGMRQSRR